VKVWKIMYGSLVVVGLVLDTYGSHSANEALSAWNSAHPSYQGDSAESGPFMEI